MKNFENYAAFPGNPKWENLIQRQHKIYQRNNDLRSDFQRDYTRIIHSTCYRRLKHKTQVFFSPESDHICTRIEHVTYVESISYTIAKALGLNTELTKAISIAHDVGHSPFGHQGESILSKISERDLGCKFWHEKNGLDMVDKLELLEDSNRYMQNLNLTYAVRDGIISHCGEIDENSLKPRDEFIDLNDYVYPNQYSPYTWEGCVVKISDKISYIGRDIEDALALGIIDDKKLDELYSILGRNKQDEPINNTIVLNYLIYDLCQNSSPEEGLKFSDEALNLMDTIKEFNLKNIYLSEKTTHSLDFASLVLNKVYNTLKSQYDGQNTLLNLEKIQRLYPKLVKGFLGFIKNYFDYTDRNQIKLKNDILFSLNNEKDYYKAIIYYISGMTDNLVIELYNEIIGFWEVF